jgi:pyruvate dehydrogenase E2 component (dihydrolipoamide acetyltransferase)
MARLLRVVEVATGSTEVMLHEWAVPERTGYSVGDVLATLETDKAVVDIEADADGTLVAHLATAGDTVEVGAPIALLASPGEQVPDLAAELRRLGVTADAAAGSEAGREHRAVDPVPDQPSVSSMSSQSSQSSQPVTPASPSSAGEHSERVFSSPLARRMARDAGLTVSELVGSGPGGRIVKRDVRAAIDRRGPVAVGPATTAPLTPSGSTTPPYVDVPHTGVRRATAARQNPSNTTTPPINQSARRRGEQRDAPRNPRAAAGGQGT